MPISSLAGRGRFNASDTIAASTTDSVLVAAIPGNKIRVHALVINQGDTTPSSVTLNSKGAGAGTAIGPPLKASANGGFVLPYVDGGWLETTRGEGLTVTTGVGSTSAVIAICSTT